MGCTDKTRRMTARDGEDDLDTNFDCVLEMQRVDFFVYARAFQVLDVVLFCALVVQWQGAEGSPFQHQQADESLGPNSLKAKLALLLSLLSVSLFLPPRHAHTHTYTQPQI